MNYLKNIVLFCCFCLLLPASVHSQVYRQNGKWGYKENGKEIIKPVYDTIYGYDSTGKVCLACFKTKTSSSNKFMKVMTTTYACNYFDREGKKLMIRNSANDTFTVFSLAKSSLRQYQGNSRYFVAAVKNKKFLLDKNFRQITFNEYAEVSLCEDPGFYIVQNLNEFEVMHTGLVNLREEVVIPYLYSHIKVNPSDSLIICCAAGLRANAEDDVYNYEGKKVASSHRHIELATKNFLIHQIYEPKEYFLFYNQQTKEETKLTAEAIERYTGDQVLAKIKGDWFIYDLKTNQKTPVQKQK